MRGIGRNGVRGAVCIGALALVVAAACTQDQTLQSLAACSPAPNDPAARSTRSQLLAEAVGNYNYGPARAAISDTSYHGGPGGPLPTMTIASALAESREGRPARNLFVGRIVSDGPYNPLGVATGTNYLWTDSVAWASDSGPVRVLVVPADTTCAMAWLDLDPPHARMTAGDPEPLLRRGTAGYVACTDGCSSGHCPADSKWRDYDAARDSASMRITGS